MGKQRVKTSGSLWSKQEIKLLSELYPTSWPKDLVGFFPKRNKATIIAKALELGLSSARPWKQQENALLRRVFAEAKQQDLITSFPSRSLAAILAKGERLGLKRERNHPRKGVNENYFEKWSANMAYLLGYILADGCIIEGTYKGYSGALKFGVQKRDIDILEKIRQELRSEHAISVVGNAAHLCITSQKIVNNLKKLGIAYRKSLREKVPDVPQQYLRDFIRGVIDGDGGISFTKKGYPTLQLCGGKRVTAFVRDHFLANLHVYSTIGKRTKSKSGNFYLFAIGYRGNSAKTITTYLYHDASLYLDRKFFLAKRCINLQINRRKDYTQEEKELIKHSYLTHLKSEMLALLTNRTWSSIQQQAHSLGLYKYKRSQ